MSLFGKGNSKSQNVNDENSSIRVAIDIGSSNLRIVAGEINEEGILNIIYSDVEPSAGVINGAVCDLQALTDALTNLVQRFIENTQISLNHCNIGIAGSHITSMNEMGTAAVPTRTVTVSDKNKAMEVARAVTIPEGSHIIHEIAQNYAIENNKEIINPVGLHAVRLNVYVHIITCNIDQENNFRTALEKLSASVFVDHVIFTGLAAADAVLTDSDKEIGVCLIEFGAGTINVCVYDRKRLVMSFSNERGGQKVTEAIANAFHLPISAAENLKLKCGVATRRVLQPIQEDYNYVVKAPQIESSIQVNAGELADVIDRELTDIFQQICCTIDRTAREQYSLGAGFVITGGMANMPGIVNVASINLNPRLDGTPVNVRVCVPRGLSAECSERYARPELATPVGLLRYTINESKDDSSVDDVQGSGLEKFINKVKVWISREF